MSFLKSLRRTGSAFRVVRQFLREQHAQTLALQEIAKQLRIQNADSTMGFVTGAADGQDDAGLSYTSSRDIVELLAVEQDLYRKTGIKPSEEEVVAEWEARRT